MLSAALFIEPENLSLQQSTINLHVRLSLGAEPSCSRPPWVKLNRFSPTPPQSGVLVNVWGTVEVRATKKPLTTAPGNGSHALTGTGACVNGFILLTVTTTVRMLQLAQEQAKQKP